MDPNQKLFDSAVRRAMRREQFSNGEWRKIRRLLRRIEKDLEDKISAGTGSTLQSRKHKGLIKRIRETINGGAREFEKRLVDSISELAGSEADEVANVLRSSLPKALTVQTPSAALIEAAALSKPMRGAMLADWVSDWSATTKRRVESQIAIGMVEGQTTEQIVRSIFGTRENKFKDGIVETSRRSARTIVRTATNHVSAQAREVTYAENADIIQKVRWVSTLDTRTSLICASLDGKEFPVGKGPRPPAHPNCRSTTVPIIFGSDELKKSGILPKSTRASFSGQIDGDVSFDGFLRRQGDEFALDYLGPARFKKWKDGARLDSFVNNENRVLRVDEL